MEPTEVSGRQARMVPPGTALCERERTAWIYTFSDQDGRHTLDANKGQVGMRKRRAHRTATKVSGLMLNKMYNRDRFIRFSFNDPVNKSAAQLPVSLPADLAGGVGFA